MSKGLSRRDFQLGAIVAGPLLSTRAASQSAIPQGPITMIVPFAAGGATDVVARHVARRLGELIGQSVIVENIGGAGGVVGTSRVAKAQPDGKTIMMGTVSTHAINPLIARTPPYDPIKDFTPISNIAIVPNVLLVTNAFPVKTVSELIALLKAEPDKHSYGSSGVGSTLHLSGEMFKAAAGVRMQHVPYRGGGPAMNDLVGSQIPIMFDVLTGAAEFIRNGSVRALGIATKTRSPAFPDMPTISETGLPGFETFTWNAIFGPAGMSKPMADAYTEAFRKVVSDKEIQQKLSELSAVPVGSSAEELTAFVKAEIEKLKPVVAAIGLKVD